MRKACHDNDAWREKMTNDNILKIPCIANWMWSYPKITTKILSHFAYIITLSDISEKTYIILIYTLLILSGQREVKEVRFVLEWRRDWGSTWHGWLAQGQRHLEGTRPEQYPDDGRGCHAILYLSQQKRKFRNTTGNSPQSKIKTRA